MSLEKEERFQGSYDFGKLDQLPANLYWINDPPDFELDSNAGGLRVSPAGGKDFWQKTFYTPTLIKADGPALLRRVPEALKEWRAEVHFSLENVTAQFDQAGIMVYQDSAHWLKAGVEVVDGVPRMSCVVTNTFSDWSVQPWRRATDVTIRVSYVRQSFAVEYEGEDGKWHFYRIAPSMVDKTGGELGVGMMCCAPTKAGMAAVFHCFSISDKVSFDHYSCNNLDENLKIYTT